ncbi:TetR/AcrR family transcriptional regulator [Herbiconiux sp. CPCC 205716]|uniref:TetR/AcrR family transcriptional regulator n=1 Tax=Herbiconiux gentiana TaxID=2970912 RepID=A0ABT2GAI4_9MICO|nr:TetR/AcrR family transcriptional regulator [Herbiconiux gentiana]MCS5713202.1 TetR/AcrR family transcriptional regulator [Herbiconiux gentiana]
MSEIAVGPPDALRSDARRNRERLVEAAGELLALGGIDVSVAEIAARAGVGKGTVFRHYAAKDDLVADVVCAVLERLLAQGRELQMSLTGTDALREFVAEAIQLQANDRAFCEVVAGASVDNVRVSRAIEDFNVLVRDLTNTAVKAGDIRPDVTGADISLLISGIYQTAAPRAATQPELWRRYFVLFWDGLLPVHASPLPVPPAVGVDQF